MEYGGFGYGHLDEQFKRKESQGKRQIQQIEQAPTNDNDDQSREGLQVSTQS